MQTAKKRRLGIFPETVLFCLYQSEHFTAKPPLKKQVFV